MSTRAAVVAACRRLAAAGLVPGTAGNLSQRDDEHVWITASGAAFDAITEAQVVKVDLQGRLVEGAFAPTSEIALHLGVYAAHGSGAVVHTHAPAATAVACVHDELPVVHYALLALGGAVPVAPYATFGTQELADGVVAVLAGRGGALMAQHGAVTHAATLDKAVELMEVLEWACDVYGRAVAQGTPRVLTQAEQDAVVEAALSRGYGTPEEPS
ncbi:MAG TPA: class II aldolase/adducin family protein [Mycobacteriales bacterium]|nr:class II aldolase/adducin family protein [Mycobacteriales bacterium]